MPSLLEQWAPRVPHLVPSLSGIGEAVSESAVVRPGGLVPAAADGGRMGTAAIEGGVVIVEE